MHGSYPATAQQPTRRRPVQQPPVQLPQQATMSVVLRSLFGFLWGSSPVNIVAIIFQYIFIVCFSFIFNFLYFLLWQGMLWYADSLPLFLCPAQIPMTCCPCASHLGMRGLGHKKRIVTEWAWTGLFFLFLKVYPWPKLTRRVRPILSAEMIHNQGCNGRQTFSAADDDHESGENTRERIMTDEWRIDKYYLWYFVVNSNLWWWW